MQVATLQGRQSIGNEWLHGNLRGGDDELGLAYIPVIVPIAAGTLSVLLLKASWDTYTQELRYPRESEAQKQLWSFKTQLMKSWNFTADEYPRAALVAMLDKLQSTAAQALTMGGPVRYALSGPWTAATAVTEARMQHWEQTFGGLRVAAIQSIATRSVNGTELISAAAFKNLRDYVNEFVIDARAYANDLEYASLNDTWRFPWAANILKLLESFFVAVFKFLMNAADAIVALLQLMAEFARQLALTLRGITNWLPYILGGGALAAIGFFVYRRTRPHHYRRY